MNHLYAVFIASAVLFVAGGLLLWAARRADDVNYLIEKATPLPLRLINPHDDVWLRGQAECSEPLYAPHFALPCLYFEYTLEEKVTRTVSAGGGKTRTETSWVVRDRQKGAAVFSLRQDKLSIEIDGARAAFKNLSSRTDYQWNLRHSLSYLPYPAQVSCIGCVSEDGRRLEPYARIPLLVTPLSREEFIKKAERGERLLRFFGFLCLFLGAGGLLYGPFDVLGWPRNTGGSFAPELALYAAGGAFLVHVFVWSVYLYNTFVQYRRRVDNAWANIDPDLKMRADLIPALVEVAKGYMKHEREILESLSMLRSGSNRADKIAAESALAAGTARLMGTVEKYPQLRADAAVGKIFRELQALEEKIAHGREFYNATVREYNDNVMAFPRGLVARLFGFRPERYFNEVNAE